MKAVIVHRAGAPVTFWHWLGWHEISDHHTVFICLFAHGKLHQSSHICLQAGTRTFSFTISAFFLNHIPAFDQSKGHLRPELEGKYRRE